MKMTNAITSTISLFLLISTINLCAEVEKITENEMREAAKSMNAEEIKLMENHLKNEIKKTKTPQEREKLESITQSFYKGRYDLVMQELKSLGENPQKILKTTGLREKMLSGELERLPWFIREIAALDFSFERDAKATVQKWPAATDKALYIIGLIDQLERNHQRVEDKVILKDSINNVRDKLGQLAEHVPGVFKRQISTALTKLDTANT